MCGLLTVLAARKGLIIERRKVRVQMWPGFYLTDLMTNHFTHSLFFGYSSARFTLVMSMRRTSLLVYYFSLLVCVHQLVQQNLKFSISLLHSETSPQAILANMEGRRKMRERSCLIWPMFEWFHQQTAESASCSQMRMHLSNCLSVTQCTSTTILFSVAHIYTTSVPMIYRWWKNEEHKEFCHKPVINF